MLYRNDYLWGSFYGLSFVWAILYISRSLIIRMAWLWISYWLEKPQKSYKPDKLETRSAALWSWCEGFPFDYTATFMQLTKPSANLHWHFLVCDRHETARPGQHQRVASVGTEVQVIYQRLDSMDHVVLASTWNGIDRCISRNEASWTSRWTSQKLPRE